MAADVPGGLGTLQADLERRHPAPRWFQTLTWTSVRDELDEIVVHPAQGILGSDVQLRRQTLMATSMVFVIRELLSRLTVSLLMIGSDSRC